MITNTNILQRNTIDGDEIDWVSLRSRRILIWKEGDGKVIKKRMNKRYRRKGKAELRRYCG